MINSSNWYFVEYILGKTRVRLEDYREGTLEGRKFKIIVKLY